MKYIFSKTASRFDVLALVLLTAYFVNGDISMGAGLALAACAAIISGIAGSRYNA